MNTPLRCTVHLGVFVALNLLASLAWSAKVPQPIAWQSPAFAFSEYGLDANKVADLIGDGSLLIHLPPRDIALWSQGALNEYPDARITMSLAVFERPSSLDGSNSNPTESTPSPLTALEEVSQLFYLENKANIVPETVSVTELSRSGNHTVYETVYKVNAGLFSLRASSQTQQSVHDNGDISFLSIKGYVDVFFQHFEFIALADDRVLVIDSEWVNLDTAPFYIQSALKSMPEFDVMAANLSAWGALQPFKGDLLKENEPRVPIEDLPTQPTIPLYTANPESRQLLTDLGQIGEVTLMQPVQWYNDNGSRQAILFSSGISLLPIPLSVAQPYLIDQNNLLEFMPGGEHLVVNEIPNGDQVQLGWKACLVIFCMPMEILYDVVKQSDEIYLQGNASGDLEPVLGAQEVVAIEVEGGEHTLTVLTQASRFGDSMPWMLKGLVKRYPMSNVLSSLPVVILASESRRKWVLSQVVNDDRLVAQ
ncbi:MAG: hypothetical protein COB04_17830 [Gammaproteobacteria bacterium]|nr:MAG: hypothetical protein COB04_17830 [Gammaproteobacteria bacterium]